MRTIAIFAALAVAVPLAACGDRQPETAPTKVETPKPAATPEKPKGGGMSQAEVKQFSVSFEEAMREIPPELRNDFQKYMECEIQANNKRPAADQKQIDGSRVREMTKALQANRALANCAG